MKRALCISTLDLDDFQHGGVVTKALVFARIAMQEGFEPFFLTPSVHLHQTVKRTLQSASRPKTRCISFHGYSCYQFGARFPELEFNAHRFESGLLGKLLDETISCFAVSGNNHAARPFLDLKLPFGVWPGSTYWEDCRFRIHQAPGSIRKLLDLATKPWCEHLEYRIFQEARSIITDTYYTRKCVVEIDPRWVGKISVVPVPVDVERYSPSSSPSRNHLVFLGRLSDPRKNMGLLLRAFQQVASKHPTLELVLIGSSIPETREEIQKLSHYNRIRMISDITEPEKIEWIRNALALVIPSLQEGFGIVGAEALACGVPVISTPCGGPEDYVVQGETGFLLRGFDPDEMATAVLELAGQRPLQDRLSQSCRDFAVKHLGLQAVAPKLVDFIHRIVN